MEELSDRVTFKRPEIREGARHAEILEDIRRRHLCVSACVFF